MSLTADINRIIRNIRAIDSYMDGEIRGKRVFNKAARIVVAEMKRQAPVDEGVLKKNIKKISSRKSRNSIIIGSKFPQPNRPTNHAWLAEHGHETPYGNYVPGDPYVRRTYEATKNQMNAAIIDELKVSFEKSVKGVFVKNGR